MFPLLMVLLLLLGYIHQIGYVLHKIYPFILDNLSPVGDSETHSHPESGVRRSTRLNSVRYAVLAFLNAGCWR